MRIAYVYDAVFPWETGGVQKRVWELARRLSDRHDVHWYGLKYWEGPRVIEREGVTLHGVGAPRELYVDGRRSIREALSYSARLVRPLLDERFDVIDCQEFPYFPVFPSKLQSLRHGSALFLTWHEVWGNYWYEYLGWKGAFGKTIERLAARVPHEHVAVSDRTRRDLGRMGVSDVRVVPNGISMDEIDAVESADRSVDVLFVGRLIAEKNASLLIRALVELRSEMPNVRCVVVGDGPEREAVEGIAADLDLGSNVTFTGELSEYEDVLALMKAADVFALPSRREGFGISALEALACGTPVVTIAHPQNAARELVTDGVTGVVCEQRPDALAAGLRHAMTSLSASACTDAARHYEWDRISEMTEGIYESATE